MAAPEMKSPSNIFPYITSAVFWLASELSSISKNYPTILGRKVKAKSPLIK